MGLWDWAKGAEQAVEREAAALPGQLEVLRAGITQAAGDIIMLQAKLAKAVQEFNAFRQQHAKEIADLTDLVAHVQLGVPAVPADVQDFLKLLADWKASQQPGQFPNVGPEIVTPLSKAA